MKTKYLNTNYVDSVYGSYNFNFDDNYEEALYLLSKTGDLTTMKRYQLDILREEIYKYFDYYKVYNINNDILEECENLMISIIEDVEYDLFV